MRGKKLSHSLSTRLIPAYGFGVLGNGWYRSFHNSIIEKHHMQDYSSEMALSRNVRVSAQWSIAPKYRERDMVRLRRRHYLTHNLTHSAT